MTFVEGASFDGVLLDRVLHSRHAALDACFAESDRAPEGSTMRVRVIVGPDGQVAPTVTSIAVELERAAPCITTLFSHFRFAPAPDAPSTYDVELRLRRAPIEPGSEPGECPVHPP